MAAFCRDCLTDAGDATRCPACGSPRLAAPPRTRHADHRPCRLRRVLRHDREARRPFARRQAADRRRRQARRGLDRLLHRAHLRRALGDADVRGAAALPARHHRQAEHGRNTSASAAQVRALMLELTPQVEPISIDEAFIDLSGTQRLHGMSAAKVLARFAAQVETRDRHHGLDRAVRQQVPRQDRLRSRQAARLCRARARRRPRRSSAPSRSTSSTASARSRRRASPRTAFALIADLQRADERDLMRRYGAEGQRLCAALARHRRPRGRSGARAQERVGGDHLRDATSPRSGRWRSICGPPPKRCPTGSRKSSSAGSTVTLKLKTRISAS